MTKSRVIWFGTLGLLIGLVALDRHATRRQMDDLRHQYTVMADAEAARKDDVGRVIGEQLALLARAANTSAAAPQTIASQPTAAEGSNADPPPPPKQPEHTYTEHAAHIEQVLSQESRDPNWSQAAEGQLATALAPLSHGNARIDDVTCGKTLCRVRVEEVTEDGLHDLVNQIFAARDKSGYWKGSMFTAHDPASPADIFANVVYFAKENYPIPFIVN